MLHSLRCSTVVALASAILAGAALLAAAQPPPEPPSSSGGSLFGPAQANAKSVVTVRAQFTAPAADQPGRLWITATIAPGWHIYSITQPPGGPLATKIEVSPPPGVRMAGKFQALTAPERKQEPAFDNLMVESHHGTVTWYAPLELAAGVDPAKMRNPRQGQRSGVRSQFVPAAAGLAVLGGGRAGHCHAEPPGGRPAASRCKPCSRSLPSPSLAD